MFLSWEERGRGGITRRPFLHLIACLLWERRRTSGLGDVGKKKLMAFFFLNLSTFILSSPLPYPKIVVEGEDMLNSRWGRWKEKIIYKTFFFFLEEGGVPPCPHPTPQSTFTSSPTNNALLINFLLSSDAEISLMSTD